MAARDVAAASNGHAAGRARDLRVRLLGGFALTSDGEPVALPLGAQRMIAFLALRDRSVQRVFVAGTLWLDTTEARSCANLRSALWRIRSLDPTIVLADRSHLRLNPAVGRALPRAPRPSTRPHAVRRRSRA